MSSRSLRLAALLVAAGALTVPPVPARAQGVDPCAAIICLGGLLVGQDGGSSCVASVGAYFAIQVIDMIGFDAPLTLVARTAWLNTCPAPGMSETIDAVSAAYGELPDAP